MSKSPKRPALSSLPAQQIDAAINMLADNLLAQKQELLAIWGMTPLQYEALYALYCSDAPLSNSEVSANVNTRVPDITRLLDRMAEKGWLTRNRDPENRRIMRASLTATGTTLVESALAPLTQLYQEALPGLTHPQQQTLLNLLHQALNLS